MSYCPKCGNKVEETMAFCPSCGTSLKASTAPQPAPSQPIPRQEKPVKQQKQEKTEHGFIGYLIGGLILVILGVFALLELSGYFASSGQGLAIMLLIIGIIVIVGAIYVALTSRRHSPEHQ